MERLVFFAAGIGIAWYADSLRVDAGGEHIWSSAALLALALASFTTALIGISDEEESALQRGLGFYMGVFFVGSLVVLISVTIGTVFEAPPPLNPPDDLALGSTLFFQQAFTLEEIALAQQAADYGFNFVAFLSALVVLLITFVGTAFEYPHWNNRLALLSVCLLVVWFAYASLKEAVEYSTTSLVEISPEEVVERLYPDSPEHCEARFAARFEQESSVSRERESKSYIVDSGAGSSVVTVTGPDKEWKYQEGYTITTELTHLLFAGGQCDTPRGDEWESPCTRYVECMSAASHNASGGDRPFELLSTPEIVAYGRE